MPLRRPPTSLWWQLSVMVAVVVVVGGLLLWAGRRAVGPDEVDCSRLKCVSLTFDDGPSPFTDRLLRVLADGDAKRRSF